MTVSDTLTHRHLSRRQFIGTTGAGAALTVLGWPASLAARDKWPAITAYLQQFVGAGRVPGALAMIGQGPRPFEVVARGTIAMDSRRPVDADTLWRLYSMTKPITGIAAMMLVEEGRLTLDQPLYDLIPSYRDMQVLVRADAPVDQVEPARVPITIRQLLTHTAGLGYSIIQRGPIKIAYEAAGIVPGQVSRLSIPGLDRGTPAPSLAAFAERLARLPLVYQPGTRWSYSVALDLLARVIEIAGGLPFDAFLQRRIFDPLGMTSTWFRVPASAASRLATNYAPVGGILLPIDPGPSSIYLDQPPFPFGGAGLVGSARDYDRFLMMLLGEGQLGRTRILRPETSRLAMSNLLPAGIATQGTMIAGSGFGAGGRVSLPGSAEGEGTFGWGGAAGTVAFVSRARGARFGAYANYMPAEAYDFQRRMPEIALQDLRG